jgi:RNA polymerase sigma-70 factor (ECF subfamily)
MADRTDEFLALYDAYADAVFRMCYAKVSSREEAKDLSQEAFTRVFERMSSGGERIENLRAFLFTVARNLVKDHYKRKKPVLERDLPEGAMEAVGVEPDADRLADARIAFSALAKLPDQYREALSLHLVEGYGISEVAEMLGERPNTVSVRVKRGVEKLRVMLRTDTP